MIINGPRKRCRYGFEGDSSTFRTRCYKNAGHSGPHHAKLFEVNPYQETSWLPGTHGEFLTDKQSHWAWQAKGRSRA